jgi:hypothetical protein
MSFSVPTDQVMIPANGAIDLDLVYLPFHLGQQECTISFCDAKVGEFFCKIEGTSFLPSASEPIHWSTNGGIPLEKSIRIVPTNQQRDKAISLYIHQHLNGAAGMKAKQMMKISAEEREAYQLPRKGLRYSIEYSSPYFTGPSELVLQLPSHPIPKSLDFAYTELPVTFAPNSAGRYPCKLILNCKDVPDVRVYQIVGLARVEGSSAELEIHTQAKQAVVQEIPIENPSEDLWPMRIVLQGIYFSAPTTINVAAKSCCSIPIAFQPLRPGTFDAQIVVHNLHTGQNHYFKLTGFASEPDPVSIIEVTGQVRSKVTPN